MPSSAAAATTPICTRRTFRCWRRRSRFPISGCRASRSSRQRSTAPCRRADRNWSKSTWWRSVRSPSRLPVRRLAPRAARDGAAMTSILTRLRQPLRRGEVEDLRGVTIDEPIDLQGAELPNLDFSGATFNAPLQLRDMVFQGLAWFAGCSFNAPVDLSGAIFLNDSRFERARFRRVATFSGAEFRGVACFDAAEFGDAAFLDRLTCYGNLSLDRTRFGGAASLQDSECFGGLWANRTVFATRADVRGLEVHGRTWLVGAAVAEDATPAAAN